MNALVLEEAEDWTVAEQVVRARNLARAMHDELSHLWILARGGEPSTEMEKLIRSQIDDAAAETVDIYTELKQILEWLVDHEVDKPGAATSSSIERRLRAGELSEVEE